MSIIIVEEKRGVSLKTRMLFLMKKIIDANLICILY